MVDGVVEHSYAEIEKSVVRKVMKFLLRVIVKLKLHKAIPRRLRGKVKEHGLGLKAPLTVFDIEKSKVIVLGYTIPFGAIHVNPKHVTNIESFIAEFIEKLSESVKEIKSTLEVKVWKVKDLYHGEKTHYLPEVMFTINDWSCVIIKDPNEEFIYLDAPYSSRHTGSHRLHGVFVVHGEGISRGRRLDNVTILDVAPTILHILGVPIPSSMDGRVLTEIFNPSSVYAKIEPRYVDPSHYTRLKLATRIMHACKSGLRRRRIAREHM